VTFGNVTTYTIQDSHFSGATNACLNIDFSSSGLIKGNQVDTCAQGIIWWGGDATVSSTPTVSDITIDHNTVSNITGGCIWGGLGTNITATNNTVSHCGDVGIDFEGTFNSTMSGNDVTDCVTAAYSVFNGSANDTITGNSATQEAGFGRGFGAYGLTTVPSSSITVSGNTFHTNGHEGIGTDQGTLNDSLFENNTITTVGPTAGVRVLEGTRNDVKGNVISVTSSNGISFEGPSDSTISGNTVTTTQDTSTGGQWGGIFLYWRSSAFPTQRNIVQTNSISGFVSSINDDCWGNIASDNQILNNTVDTIYRRAGSGYTGVVSGNHTPGAQGVTASTY
jgi:parallel beta-helix repeat protein